MNGQHCDQCVLHLFMPAQLYSLASDREEGSQEFGNPGGSGPGAVVLNMSIPAATFLGVRCLVLVELEDCCSQQWIIQLIF